MKILFHLGLFLTLVSCQKKQGYICYCTTTEASLWGDPKVTKSSYTIYNTRKKAEKECTAKKAEGIWINRSCSLSQ